MESADSYRYFSLGKLEELGSANCESYVNAEPYPHIAFDDFVKPGLLAEVVKEIPESDSKVWRHKRVATSDKLSLSDVTQMGDSTRELLNYLNSAPFLQFLESLTGVEGIIPDPYYFGGGLHQIQRGGYLKVHADFNYHEKLKLDRRLNALLYLNQDWQPEYGGALELWDRKMKGKVKEYLPVFNRFVVFNTTDYSYHGHPDPLTCPAGIQRNSIALYYYTNGRPRKERSRPHSTIYKLRKGLD